MMFARGDSSRPGNQDSSANTAGTLPERLMLWVDQVGGFLVCLNEEVRFGAVTGEPAEVDIPIMANLSRLHLTLKRRGESYSLDPHASTLLGERALEHETYLSSNSQFQIAGVGFRFRQPTVLSASAVLDRLTSHRIAEGAEGVVLMEDLCLLGPGADHHIVCRHWEYPIILFRRNNQLFCKSPGPLFVDEELVQVEQTISHGQIVTGTDARFRVEFY